MTQINFISLAAVRNLNPIEFDCAINKALLEAVEIVGKNTALKALSPNKLMLQEKKAA